MPCVWGRGRSWYGALAQPESHFTCSSPRRAPRMVPSTFLLNYFGAFLGGLGRGEGAPLVWYLCKTHRNADFCLLPLITVRGKFQGLPLQIKDDVPNIPQRFRATVSRVLFRKRELTEFCVKLAEFCEKLGEFVLAHK